MAKTNRAKSIKREDSIASDFNGRRVPMSGGSWFSPGDASSSEFLFEDKFTEKEFYPLAVKLLNKIEKQASFKRRIPVFRFGFTGTVRKNYVVILDFYMKEFDTTDAIFCTKKSLRLTCKELESIFDKKSLLTIKYIDTNNYYIIMPYDYFKDNYKNLMNLD